MATLVSKLTLILLLVGLSSNTWAAEPSGKQELVLEYLEYLGVIESIELQVETMYSEFVQYYSYLPPEFWEDPRVTDAFDDYKVALLQNYTEAMESELSKEDLEFLVSFYSSEDGKKVVSLGKKVSPIMVAAASEAGKQFTRDFDDLVESYAN